MRLCRPGKAPLPPGPCRLLGGFDADLLVDGENRFELRCRGMPPAIENAVIEDPGTERGAIVHPPGFALRIKG